LEDGQEGTYDFAFIDADKVNYKLYYELLLKLLQTNGIIAIDNVLWQGKVMDTDFQDEDTVALREISELVYKDDRVEHVMLPFADGVTLVRKK
jgi:O-methyltransferase